MDILVYVLIVALIYFVERYLKLSKQQKLFDLVSWCASPSSGIGLTRSDPLCDYISRAQHELKLLSPYCVESKEDWTLVQDILCEYQRDLADKYFNGRLDPNALKSKAPVRSEDYFMFSLYCFLDEHHLDSVFLGHKMHGEILDRQRCDPCGYNITYALSDYSLLYTRLYYIVYSFCKSNEVINPTGNRFDSYGLNFIKKQIDERKF